MSVEPKRQGWVHIIGAKKWHYITEASEGKSLCGNWLYLGRAEPDDSNHESKDNCRACQRKRSGE